MKDSQSLAKKKEKSGFTDTVRTLIFAVLIAVVIRTVAFEPFNIPSGSMIPTLLIGDYLFVSKYSYGYSRYSIPFGVNLFSGRILEDQPERGDVVVFKLPRDNSTDFIKRVIGLPGDRIQVLGGILQINGQPVRREPYDGEDPRPSRRGKLYVETLPNGVRHLIRENGDDGALDNTPIYVVPSGRYFFMGDNRDNSEDSRVFRGDLNHWGDLSRRLETEVTVNSPVRWAVGFVPSQNLIGRAEILFYSTNGKARFWEIWRWPSATRFSRLFDSVGGV